MDGDVLPSSDYEFDLPVTPEQLAAIGMVAVEWSYLESVVDAAIWTAGGLPDQDVGEAVTTHLSMRARLDMLSTLIDLPHGRDHPRIDAAEFRSAFKALRRRIETLQGKRNQFVHSRWVRGDMGSPLMYTVNARNRLTRERRGHEPEEIRAVAADIAGCARDLTALVNVPILD